MGMDRGCLSPPAGERRRCDRHRLLRNTGRLALLLIHLMKQVALLPVLVQLISNFIDRKRDTCADKSSAYQVFTK